MKLKIQFLFAAIATTASFLLFSCLTTPEPLIEKSNFIQGSRIAVFDFEINSDISIPSNLVSDIYQTFIEALLEGGGLEVVERNQLKRIMKEQVLSLSGIVDETKAAKIGRLAGANYILLGSVYINSLNAKISCRVINVETGIIVFAESINGKAENFVSLLDDLAGTVEDSFSD